MSTREEIAMWTNLTEARVRVSTCKIKRIKELFAVYKGIHTENVSKIRIITRKSRMKVSFVFHFVVKFLVQNRRHEKVHY